MTDQKVVRVNMAHLEVITDMTGVLVTTGLGSCVGLTLYDPLTKIAAMAHIMLPSSEIAREGMYNPAKYADTAVPAMIDRLARLGAPAQRLEAKMAGGAQMFDFAVNSDLMRIGPRNADSCIETLRKYNIPVKAADTGGKHGRTIEFHCESGVMIVRSVLQGVKEI
jgi:chemotaxis protein CheD